MGKSQSIGLVTAFIILQVAVARGQNARKSGEQAQEHHLRAVELDPDSDRSFAMDPPHRRLRLLAAVTFGLSG